MANCLDTVNILICVSGGTFMWLDIWFSCTDHYACSDDSILSRKHLLQDLEENVFLGTGILDSRQQLSISRAVPFPLKDGWF